MHFSDELIGLFYFCVQRQNDGGTASNGACSIECKSPKRRPVCGTDSRTYTSKCALRRARRCDKKDVELKSAGTCPQGECYLA